MSSTADFSRLAPLHPAIHLSPKEGWMNDPNGLCFVDGLWHAYYQHDPTTDTHGEMHWGHATSSDLMRWEDHPIALYPDSLGTIFSGSVVIDDDNTAGFGAGSMVAVFTHDLDGRQIQSLAASRDGGYEWEKFADNPVLVSDERDFRDPKVLHLPDGWLMALAVGDRIEFYRSLDLRRWEPDGSYTYPLDTKGVWECPDLIRLPGSEPGWLLTFCVVDAGPYGHSATLCVEGTLHGTRFEPTSAPQLLDNGPDFYATQSFHGAPNGEAIVMAWMSSWQYSSTHPSNGRRGVQSIPRRLHCDAAGVLRSTPTIATNPGGKTSIGAEWQSKPGTALAITSEAPVLSLRVVNDRGPVATVEIADGLASLTRHEGVVDGYAQRYEVEIEDDGEHAVLVDHGTLEVFCAGGRSTLSALTFPGPEWTVQIDGRAELTPISEDADSND